jgi:UDP-GlcNAc:undecaprenyl-phosphate GlcNAc-1-phosphate transferase
MTIGNPTVLLALATSFAGSFLAMPVLVRYLPHLGGWDVPNHRSSHREAVPRGAGVGVAFGVVLALMAVPSSLVAPAGLLVFVIVMLVLGLADDLSDIPVRFRLLIQLSAATGAVWLGWTGEQEREMFTAALIALLLAAYVNAFNFMDGINGISGLSALAAAGWYLYLGMTVNAAWIAVFAAALAGSAAGFLPWNAPKARIFLGDSGSYAIGAALGVLALGSWFSGVSVIFAVVPLLIYALDTGWTLAWRLVRREVWFEAHRQHGYQRLADRLGGHLAASLVVVGFIGGCALTVVVFPSEALKWIGALLVGALYLAVSHRGRIVP